MKQFIRIGVDLAKNYFQVHAVANEGGPAVTRKLKRSKMHEFFAQIEPCLIGMEACGSAHYWARELETMGHEVLLMPPAYTKPYVKRGKCRFTLQGGTPQLLYINNLAETEVPILALQLRLPQAF